MSQAETEQSRQVLSFAPLTEGILLRRYRRFLADVRLADGTEVTAHCPNTGPMTGVCQVGSPVRIRHDPSPHRKLAWTWEQIQVCGHGGQPEWVGINTALPNRLLEQAIRQGRMDAQLGAHETIRREVTYGRQKKSRIDLLLDGGERPVYVEIKNTTWSEGPVALFPDTETTRGQKHLQELMDVLPTARAVLLFCVNRSDCPGFAPGDRADPRYGELFRMARSAGVEMYAPRFSHRPDGVDWCGLTTVLDHQPDAPAPGECREIL